MPEKYYLTYFHYVLNFVEKQYDHILDEPEYAYYQSFRTLTEDAQCLYIRCLNRKGNFFRLSKINYTEINDIESAKEELLHQDFIDVNQSPDMIQFDLFTRQELMDHFTFLDKKLRKPELIELLGESDIPTIHEHHEILELKKNEEIAFIKLLFFGNMYGQMTDFVVRDVGNVKIEPLDESKFKPWFQSREEAIGVMHISQLKKLINELITEGLPLEDFLPELPWNTWLSHAQSRIQAEKLILKMAYHFEQQGEVETALSYYAYTDKHPSRERQIRLLDKMGDQPAAITIAQTITENASNASEFTFAMDFLGRSGIRIDRSMTKRLKNAPTVKITKSHNKRVEQAVLDHFEAQGWSGIHAENFVWRGLFGLSFWDILFDESHGSFHHPLQRQPSDLNNSLFFETRVESLEQRLNKIRSKKQFTEYVTKVYREKEGVANRFVSWHEGLLTHITIMTQKLPLKGLKQVLLEMAKNMKENSAGFPDLFVWNEKAYHFYEIKSPNDHLSAQQLFWMDFLAQVKIKADILRVVYDD